MGCKLNNGAPVIFAKALKDWFEDGGDSDRKLTLDEIKACPEADRAELREGLRKVGYNIQSADKIQSGGSLVAA